MTLLFSATLFLSSFLMFMVEPMVAKMVLPIFGGAPMVWNTCVVFFQAMLLAGYAYAHAATTRLGPRRHSLLYVAVILAPLATLPFSIRLAPGPLADTAPVLSLLALLAGAIGIPFLVLSTCASVLQKLFSQSGRPGAEDPYFLYAASNTGSLLALLTYPTLVEPRLSLGQQSAYWTAGYVLLVAAVLACISVVWRGGPAGHAGPAERPASSVLPGVTWSRRSYWTLLAFVPSSLMLSVTTYLSTDIASVPLLWIAPLSLYLLTFVLVFGMRGAGWYRFAHTAFAWLVVPLAVLMPFNLSLPLWVGFPLHLSAFFMAALFCHGALAHQRPPPERLTEFYFWMALGGVLGGIFNTLIAPVLFSGVAEYPLVLVAAALLRMRSGGTRQGTAGTFAGGWQILLPLVMSATTAIAVTIIVPTAPAGVRLAAFALPMLVFALFFRRHGLFAGVLALMLAAGMQLPDTNGRRLHAERTFFGVYRVLLDPAGAYRSLISGTTLHGRQAVDPRRQSEPLTYYHRTGPLGQAFSSIPALRAASRVAVVGLGVGSLAAYSQPGQHFTFYEIDPAVERIARSTFFTYLRSCGERCQVVLGDARLSLERTSDSYDLIVLDAFSSDAIPLHLMTSEALALYLRHLSPDGVLAFHVSNRHLSLGPVVARLAAVHQLYALQQREAGSRDDDATGKTASDWIVMARDQGILATLAADSRWGRPVPSTSRVWTDDFSNVLGVITVRRLQ